MTYATGRRGILVWALVGAMAVAACGSPIDDDHDHGDDVEGFELVLNGETIAAFDGDSRTWTGTLEVDAGEETAHIDVRPVDHDGDVLDLDGEFHLGVDIGDETVAEFEQATPGEFGGRLHGVAAGQTTVVFHLVHGAVGAGHPDFSTTELQVQVN